MTPLARAAMATPQATATLPIGSRGPAASSATTSATPTHTPADVEKRPSELFSHFDLDNDGSINREEFLAVLERWHIHISPEQVDALMKALDTDGDGRISAAEFSKVLQSAMDTDSKVCVSMVIPSTSSVDVQGTEADLLTRRNEVLQFFAQRFGGSTAKAAHQGAYQAYNGDLVYEQGIVVDTFTTPVKWKESASRIRKQVQLWCSAWGQECIALIVNGSMEFVVPPENSASPEQILHSMMRHLDTYAQWGVLD
ncbi:unnamed protein product [Prorocentrum cordatum]|nr:unnamed protein product [Polarella glacialis]